ncbi:MAG: DNA ligase [Campylobacterales bacterium]
MRFWLGLWLACLTALAAPAELMLAKPMPEGFDPGGWWMSEKYDGVRAYWDGKQLWTRQQNPIAAPESFTKQLPPVALDGELWLGRGRFEETASIVLSFAPDERWQKIKFRAFDAPLVKGGFEKRLEVIPGSLRIEQIRCKSADHLAGFLKSVEEKGGEGVMLRASDSPYQAGRSDYLLKVKSYEDAEAVVVGYKPGQGKYAGLTGSLEVQTPEGKRFFIGSGLTDTQRQNPPPIGAVITYKYRGLTANGLPRFATFWRVRADAAR